MPTLPQIATKRMVIYAKDVETITGRKSRTARKILQAIRLKLGKAKNDFVTIKEFAAHTQLSEEDIIKRLLD
jgi:hypothetical protein